MRPEPWLTLSDGSILTRQEQFVLRQVAAGKIADLKQHFGEAEEDRCLRGRFLEELLGGKLPVVKVHPQGIVIKNALVEGPINLPGAEIDFYVGLNDCIFKESVGFRDAQFGNNLSLVGSHFLQRADFDRIKVAVNLFCMNTLFSGAANFGGAGIARQFSAIGAKFLCENHRANFNHLIGGQSVQFNAAEFYGPVDFEAAEIRGHFRMTGAKFLSETSMVDFSNMQIGQNVHLEGVEFRGPADFDNINIRGQLVAHGTRFLSDHKTNFHRMQVGQDAIFQGCDFHGVVSFILIRIAGDFHLAPLLKYGQEIATVFFSAVNLREAEIGGELQAEKAHFLGHGWVNFEAVKVGRSFHASGAIFGGPVNFAEMEVKSNFYLNPFGKIKFYKTLFKGAANFSDVVVHGVFNADQAIFQSESTIFSGLKVGQGAFFIGTIFFGGLVLKEGQLNDLVIRGLHRLSKGGLPLEEIVLNRTKIAHRLTIEDVEVNKFDVRNLEVKGPAELRRMVIKGEADFRDAAFYHLQVAEISWLDPLQVQKNTEIYLDGMSYDSLTTKARPEQVENWPALLAWLSLSHFNTQNYGQLDAFFQRCALRQWADKVHIAGKRRELGKLSWWTPARWLTQFFWGLLAGYGRKPGRTLWISLGLIIFGAFLLNPAEVLAPEFLNSLAGYQDNAAHPIALRLIVSFCNFVSAIPGWSSYLTVTAPEFHLFVFLWVQRICGWILIPIGLAAVYTRLK